MVKCTKLLLASVEVVAGAAGAAPPVVASFAATAEPASVAVSAAVGAEGSTCSGSAALPGDGGAAACGDLACSKILTDSPSCSASGMVASRKMPDPS